MGIKPIFHLDYTNHCIDYAVERCKVVVIRVTEEAKVAETSIWLIPFLINIFAALKGSHFLFLFAITAAGVVSWRGPT